MSDNFQQQGIPTLATPLANPDGTINIIWYRFLNSLFQRSGLATPGYGVVTGETLTYDAVDYPHGTNAVISTYRLDVNLYQLNVYSQVTGELLGTLTLDVIPR